LSDIVLREAPTQGRGRVSVKPMEEK
jgi:hypothetical protein